MEWSVVYEVEQGCMFSWNCCVLLTAAYRNHSHAVHCDRDYRPPENPKDRQVCQFDLNTEFGQNCSRANDYGFKEGKPCILVKINKVM